VTSWNTLETLKIVRGYDDEIDETKLKPNELLLIPKK
jgi:hypothetical protein